MSGVCTIVIGKDEDGYIVGHAPALPGWHTQTGAIDVLMERLNEAIALWLEVEKESEPGPLELIGIQRLAV